MRRVWLVIGAVVVVVGVVWTLQGLNILGGSPMSGHAIFAVVGPIVGLAGLALVGVSRLWRRAPSA